MKFSETYKPPYTITPAIYNTVAEISELVGRYTATTETSLTPTLRRGNRIRTIQASLAIENNTLTIEQMTDVLDGKRVMGLPREIQEVRNAFAVRSKISIMTCLERLMQQQTPRPLWNSWRRFLSKPFQKLLPRK